MQENLHSMTQKIVQIYGSYKKLSYGGGQTRNLFRRMRLHSQPLDDIVNKKKL